ncbi:MAG: lytic transglycosylase domain-containing protein, partial [Vicinamibacteria bacterium]|nr:lytic transglycosylase domain-containing protein [Vicinamibacteria bacterium]
FDQRAVSSKGAQGLMQLMPFTSRRFGVFDAFDARQNIFGGVQYLRLLLDLFQGDVTLALAGYNAGENAVLRHKGVPPYRETRDYIQKIRGIISYAETSTLQSFTPTGRLNMAAGRSAAHIVPARPRIYYKYLDERGAAHFTHDPPAEGVTYIMLRAMD